MSSQRTFLALLAALAAMIVPLAASAAPPGKTTWTEPQLGAASGSAVGPGGALYVAQPAAGEIWRIDPRSGDKTLFASGLPPRLLPFGGVMDVAFIGSTAYALVTVVGSDLNDLFGPPDICDPCDTVGIYRIDGPDTFTVIADVGAWSSAHTDDLDFPWLIPSGVQYAMETYRGGFLVTDGHHNRVLRVGLDGSITQVIQFDDEVPTGLAVRGNTIYMAEAGPVPHEPEDGKIVSFEPGSSSATTVASGARLAVDVEIGRGQTMFALSQGHWTCPLNLLPDNCGQAAGSPADPNSGALLRVNANGTMTSVTGGLDLPSSLEIIGNSAYVVTLGGGVVKIDDIAGPPYG